MHVTPYSFSPPIFESSHQPLDQSQLTDKPVSWLSLIRAEWCRQIGFYGRLRARPRNRLALSCLETTMLASQLVGESAGSKPIMGGDGKCRASLVQTH